MRCGRCKGRGEIKSCGPTPIPCPDCTKGIKARKQTLGNNTVSVPLPEGSTCKVCGEPAVHNHHVISQQRLNRALPALLSQQAKADIRNTVPVCNSCHNQIHYPGVSRLDLAPHELHSEFYDFVADYLLNGFVPRHLIPA